METALTHTLPWRHTVVSRDYEALAHGLLEPHADAPAPRARRIAAIYAALYLEDPLLHQWCGLASFVARQVYQGLETGLGPLQDHFAKGNLAIYSDIVPAVLRFRDGRPVGGLLEAGFNALRRADGLARVSVSAAEAAGIEGLTQISMVEQEVVCQPIYDEMGPTLSRTLGPFVVFRLGHDTAALVLRFDARNPGDAAQRMGWVKRVVLPAWITLHRENEARIRADLDRVRREGGVRLDDLPSRLVPGPG